MKIGLRVMLIGTDGYMPPVGAVGSIVSQLDSGEYEVDFPEHPWRTAPMHRGASVVGDDTWVIPGVWLMPLDDKDVPVINESALQA